MAEFGSFIAQILPLLLVALVWWWLWGLKKKKDKLAAEQLNNRFVAIEDRLEKLEN